ncbi:two-component sensor histidine kinase [Polaribacter pacificus]|uniref:histidine kinase n=1 Tax=Polaribacter pacificus TaxID=1775173 RepID=A0A917HWR5_9FLAO|nr:HAMP domain-containing sensor histidine kinase [Polaribacter pacificus]GGG95349.1 two-component sensor histidine kinase [Polaribacter pacificus]
MSFFRNTVFTKRLVILVLLGIVSLILWNTYIFFQKFKQEERLKVEIFAAALKELATNTDLNASINLETKIIETNTNIPLILVNEDGSIKEWRNLDSIKAQDPNYVEAQLEIMKKENEPILVRYLNINEAIYYKDSDLLNKLTYYPIALILILILFLAVIYMLFSSSKIAEQNKLWTGMAKETAHQIGTPLSSLLGWIAILKEEKVGEKYLDEIEKDVHRLNTIANRFSKIGSVPELKKQDVVAVTKSTFEYLKNRTSKQIDFKFDAQKEVLYSKINVELFGWVIENLIKNAIDAMKGKGLLTLAISLQGKRIEISISDTGKGIPKSQFKQIFKPGFTTKKRGWGLGLSLSKRIVEEYHNGKIFVQKSNTKTGTTFKIVLLSAF